MSNMKDITANTILLHLRKSDPVMAELVKHPGSSLAGIDTTKKINPFHIFVRTIINQQLSVKAGQTIVSRVLKKQGVVYSLLKNSTR